MMIFPVGPVSDQDVLFAILLTVWFLLSYLCL